MPVQLLGDVPGRIAILRFGKGAQPGEPVFGAPPPQVFLVRLPGWDDVIHVTPTALLMPAERRQRAQRVLESIQRSPTPELAQELAKIATEIDNVQDALVVLSVLGRVGVAVTGRVLPGVSAITTAADVLNAINVLYPNTLAAATLRAAARGGARVAGRSRYALSRESKRQVEQALGLAPGTYRRRLNETIKTGKIGFGFGELLQVLQTTDWIFGTGISLGPIFGAIQDSFFGALRGAEFDITGPIDAVPNPIDVLARSVSDPDDRSLNGLRPGFISAIRAARSTIEGLADLVAGGPPPPQPRRLVIDWPGIIPVVEDFTGLPRFSIERAIEKATRPVIEPVEKVAKEVNTIIRATKGAVVAASTTVWRAGKWLVGARADLDWETHLEIALAQYLALEAVLPLMQSFDWGEAAAKRVNEIDHDTPRWMRGPDGPPSTGRVAQLMRDRFSSTPQDWVERAPTPLAREFSRALVSGYVDLLFRALEGPAGRVTVRSDAPGRALITMHDYDLLPPLSRTDVELRRYVHGLVDLESRYPHVGRPPVDVVAALHLSSFPS